MSIFTKRLKFTQPPWRIQDPRRGTVYSQTDQHIATVPKAGEIHFEQRQANLALIASAPELYAALLEAAYRLDVQGTPLSDEFYALMNRCRNGDQQLYPRSKPKENQ